MDAAASARCNRAACWTYTVAATNWRDAGKIGYALGREVRVICLSTDAREFGFNEAPGLGEDLLIVVPGHAQPADWVFKSIEPLPPLRVEMPGRQMVEFSLYPGPRFAALAAVARPCWR